MFSVVSFVRSHRTAVSVAFDGTAWILAFLIATWLRYDGDLRAVAWLDVFALGALTATAFVLVARVVMLHHGRSRVASLEEMLLLGAVTAGVGGAAVLLNVLTVWVPRSVPATATVGALVMMAWGRATWRRWREIDDENLRDEKTTRVLVVGAGEAGRELIGSMYRDPSLQWRAVGLLDDDPMKRRQRVRQVPVVGTTNQMAEKAEQMEVGTVILALPSASAATINRLRLQALEADLEVKVLPASTQLLTEEIGIRDLRDINMTDVLGRNQLDTDVAAIAGYLQGRKVLVTGAGGSIGSELCRQIHRFGPAELIMLDRDESALHALQLSIHGRALLDSNEVVLCDIRDAAAVNAIFADRRPDVVFHAAALKHLPILEQYPAESIKTNIIGTRVVLDAADLVGVETFVNVSTDKAANPCSVLGYSKRIAERVTAQRAATADGTYLSVRFGNVLGSRGSVLTAFAKQIATGGPITVTDPDVTRYFMTIEEACQLVVQAAALGKPGEALVLEMGDPISILDVAHQLIEQSGTPCKIEFTGLREGEKMHEELFGDDEAEHEYRIHPMVSHVPVPTVSDREVDALPLTGSVSVVRDAMAKLCFPVSVVEGSVFGPADLVSSSTPTSN